MLVQKSSVEVSWESTIRGTLHAQRGEGTPLSGTPESRPAFVAVGGGGGRREWEWELPAVAEAAAEEEWEPLKCWLGVWVCTPSASATHPHAENGRRPRENTPTGQTRAMG